MKMTQRLIAMLLVFVLFMTSGNFPALAEAMMTMPAALQIIEKEAFYGSTSIDRVVLPNKVKEIRSKAFANSTLSEINLPDSLTYISDDAFEGVEQVTVLANEGSYAYRWAVAHGYISEKIEVIDFSISSDELTMTEGSSYTLSTHFVPSNASTISVAWGSSNQSVATVDQGIITAKTEGTATITAIAENGMMDTCVVTVVRSIPAPVIMGAEQDGMGTVTLTWNNMGSGYEYFVYESVDDALVLLGSTADNTYTVHVAYEGVHQYCVQAWMNSSDDLSVCSDESNVYDVDVRFIWNFGATIEKIEQSTGHTAKITWRGVSPVSYYEIAKVIDDDYIVIAGKLVDDMASVEVTQGVHRYAIRAIYNDSDNKSWISNWSAVKAINVQPESAFAPVAPVLVFNEAEQAFSESEDFAPEYEQGSIDVTWMPNENAQSYALMIEKKTASGYTVVVEESDLDSTEYVISASTFADITEKTLYRFGIRSQGEVSGEYAYTYFAVTVPDASITVNSPRWERTNRYAGSRSFKVTSALPWTATTDAIWIKLYQYEDCLNVYVSENAAVFEERTGVITLDNGQNVTSITVVQNNTGYAPELTVFGEYLSTDANAPTEIPSGGFSLGIDDCGAKRVMLRFSQKTNGSYGEWQQMVTAKGSIGVPYEWENITFSAGKEFCIETSGHYSADPALYADYECEDDAPTQKYYVKFVDEGHYALLNGQQNLEITVYEKETVQLFTSNSWSASSDAAWLTFTNSRETDVRKQRLTVTAEANDSGADRTGHITVTSGNASAVLTVCQPVYTGRLIEPANVSQVEESPTMIGSDVFTYTMYGNRMRLESKEADGWVETMYWSQGSDSVEYGSIYNEDFVSGKTYRMTISGTSGESSVYYLKRNTSPTGYIQFDIGGAGYRGLAKPAGASTETITFDASGKWSITSDASWLTASPENGTSGDNKEVTVSVAANTTAEARTGILSFKIGSVVYAKLKVIQAAAGTDRVTVIVDDIPAECSNALKHVTGSGTSLSIYPYSSGAVGSSNEKIKIVSNADWITAKPEVLSGKTADVEVAENTTDSRRSGTITFTYGAASKTITIMQEPKVERVALSSPTLSMDSSSPTVLTYDENALVLKWNKAANAVKYRVYLHFNDESHVLEVNDTGSVITAELPATWFDPTYTGQYLLRITPSDANDNTGKSTSYYFMRSIGNAVYINGKASESWENVSDLTKTKQFSIASSAAWTATADVPWITFDTASGVSGDVLSVTVSANSGAARSGKVTIKSGTASAGLTVKQCAVLHDYPVISTPEFSKDMTVPTVWTKEDTLTVTWEVEPQAESYEIVLGRIKKSSVTSILEQKKNLKNTGTYTFDTSELEEGQIYSITLIREAETADGGPSAKGTRCFFTITPSEPFIEIDGVDSAELTDEDKLFEAEGEEDHRCYTITSSGTWTATVNDSDWIMVAKNKKKAKQLAEDGKETSDYEQYVGQSGDSFYISVLENNTGNMRSGSVTITTAGVSTTIDIVQEQYYVTPEIIAPSLGTSPSKSVEVPYQDIALKWTAGEENIGVYDIYLYEKLGRSNYSRVYKKTNIKSPAVTIPHAELKENTYYRLILETELKNSGETVSMYYYFHTDSADSLSISATVDWSKVDKGGSVCITAAASGGAGDYQYAYQLLLNGEIEQETPWETLKYYSFKPWSNGHYQVQIIAKDATDKCVTYTSDYTKNDANTISIATANHYTASLDANYQFLDYSVLALNSWFVVSCPEWITPSISGKGSSGNIRFVVAKNDGITRLGKIEFQSSNGIVSDLTITQTGSCSIVLTSKEGYFTSDAQASTVSFAATDKWTASSDSSWATVSAKSGSSGNRTLTVELAENHATSERNAVVSIISNGDLVQYTIHQIGKTVEQSSIKLSATSWQLNSMGAESKTIAITVNGNWTIASIPAWMSADVMSGSGNGEICLYCNNNTEQNARNGLVTIKSGNVSQDIHVSQPGNDVLASVVVFTMSEYSVETGTNVEFTVRTKNADQVQLVVDDIVYNQYAVTNDQVTFTRAFSQGGTRKVAIMPIRAGKSGLLSEYQYLTVNSNGALSKPAFTIEPENDYVGTAAVLTIPSVEHADTYTIRIYAPDSVLIVDALQISEKELAASNRKITIDSEKLLAAGTYSVNVIASGKGYSQSEEGHSLTRNARNYAVSFASPTDGTEYVPGDTIYATLNQSGGGYASIKVISPSGVETRYPDNANHTTAEPSFAAYIPVEESGIYRIYGEVFAVDLPAENNVAQKEAYITVRAKGPEISRINIAEYGKNDTWIYQSETTNLYITTNSAVETVTVKDALAESDVTVSNYALDGWNRLFTVKIPDSAAGAHTILITAFDEDTGTTATASVNFYVAVPVSGYTAYASADTAIVTSPISGKNVADVLGGAYFEPLTVTHHAGDWLRVSNSAGKAGFVQATKLSQTTPSGASGTLVLVTPDANGSFSKGNDDTITIRWKSGVAVTSQTSVTAVLENINNGVKYTLCSSTLFESAFDAAKIPDGQYRVYLQLTDATGTIVKSNTVEFTLGAYSDEDCYKEWFKNEIYSRYWNYLDVMGINIQTQAMQEVKKTRDFVCGGYVSNGDHWWKLLDAEGASTWVTMSETEKKQMYLTLVSDLVKEDQAKIEMQLAADMNNVSKVVETQQKNKKYVAVCDLIFGVVETVGAGIETTAKANALLAVGQANNETAAKKMEDFTKDLLEATYKSIKAYTEEVIEKYCSEVLIDAYKEEYVKAMKKACQEYVEYLEITLFGGIGGSKNIIAADLDARQRAALTYIKAYKQYMSNPAEMEKDALAMLFAFCDSSITMEQIERDSVNLINAMLDTFKDKNTWGMLLDNAVDLLLDELEEYVTDLLEEKLGKDLVTTKQISEEIKEVLKEFFAWDYGNETIMFDIESAEEKIKSILIKYACSTSTLGITDILCVFCRMEITDSQGAVIQKALEGAIKSTVLKEEVHKLIENGIVKAAYDLCDAAWETGEKVAGVIKDFAKLNGENHGRAMFEMYGVYLAGAFEYRATYITEAALIAWSWDYLSTMSVKELEQKRAGVITLMNGDIDALTYYRNMRRVNENAKWKFHLVLRDENGKETDRYDQDDYASYELIDAQVYWINAMKNLVMHVPTHIQNIIDKYQ